MSWGKITAIALLVISLLIVSITYEVWAAAFLGLLFALALNGPAKWLRSKWNMPAWTATMLTMLMVLTVLTGLGFMIGPPIVKQSVELGNELPVAMEKSLDWLAERKWGRTFVLQVESLSGMSAQQLNSEGAGEDEQNARRPGLTSDAGQEQSDDENGKEKDDSKDQVRSIVLTILKTLGTMVSVSAWTLMLFLVSFVVTLYVALDPDVYRRGILWLVPSRHEAVATLTMTHICIAMRWWMLGRLSSMLAVGLLTSLGMWLIGMPAPLALGALAGVLSFVPNIGPIISAAPGLLLAVPNGPWMFLSALSVYVVAQIIESNLISPLVDQYTVATPPALLVFTQVIMSVLAGVWGALIASPLLVMVLVLTQQLYVVEYLNKPIKAIGRTDDEKSADETDELTGKAATPQPLNEE